MSEKEKLDLLEEIMDREEPLELGMELEIWKNGILYLPWH